MKKTIICAIMFVMAVNSFCQQTNPSKPNTREYYLKKSKNQKTGAWVLLGGGSALIVSGLLIGNRQEASFNDAATGGVLGAIGVLSTIGSIPLFLASGRNKRKAMAATTQLRFEKNLLFQQDRITLHYYPAISIKINL